VTRRPRSKHERDRLRALDQLTTEELERNASLTYAKARQRAQDRIRDGFRQHPAYPKMVIETAPTSRQRRRPEVCRDIETRAVLSHPKIAWLWQELVGGRKGRPAMRSLVAATLSQMATFGRPDVLNCREDIVSNTLRRWAYRGPRGPKLSATYASLHRMLDRVPPGACIHVNLDLLDELVAAKDPKTGRPLHPDAFTYCAVDGTLIQANVPQKAPPGRSQRQRKIAERLIAGVTRPMAQWTVRGYSSRGVEDDPERASGAAVRKSCFGYSLVVISSIRLGLPIIWTLIPATGDERQALLAMLKTLYRLRPDFPMRFLVGDSLYAHGVDFSEHLYMRYGIHPCFARHKSISRKLRWAGSDGVPTCCGNRLMELHKYDDIWDQRKRRKQQPPLRPGAYAPSNRARLRYRCPAGKCRNQAVYLKDDWRLYTFLPRRGSHSNVALRLALMQRRNSIESLFALMKHLGPGSVWPNRMRWGGDLEMRWLCSLTLTLHTARRLAQQNGAHEEALREARDLGLVGGETPPRPDIGPQTPEQREAYERSLNEWPELAPPTGWPNEDKTVLDEEYLLPDINEFSDEPDDSTEKPG
jgi:hypothetical protein